MKLEGRTFKGNTILDVQIVVHENPAVRYSKELEEAFVLLCKAMNAPVPMFVTPSRMITFVRYPKLELEPGYGDP